MAFSESIIAYFRGDTTQLDQALRKATVNVTEQSKKMAASFLEPWKKIGTALAGYFTYAGIQELGQKMKELRHQAEQFGTSAQFIEGFQKSLKKLGVDPETAVKLMGRFVTKMGEARSGSEEAAKSFDKWGISLYDAAGNALSTEQLLPVVAERMKGIEDPALRAAMAFDLFGKSGVQLVPILSQGAKAVEDWKKKAKLSDAEIQATIDAANELKIAGDWAIRLAAALVTVAANLRHLRNNKEDGIDFNSLEYRAFKKEQWGKQSFGAKAGDILASALTLGGSAVLQEAQMRALYKRILTGNEPDNNVDTGRAEAKAQLATNRDSRAFKNADEAGKYNILIEKRKKLEEELAGFTDKESEGALRKQDELEAVQETIQAMYDKAIAKSDEAKKATEKELTIQERIAQLKQEIAGYDDALSNNGLNVVQRADIEEKKAKAVVELKQKELSLAEKIATAQENARKASDEYIKQMRDYTGLSLTQLSQNGVAGYDAGMGVRGASNRRRARRGFSRWANNLSPDEAYAHSIAEQINQTESEANFNAAYGHYDKYKSLMMDAADLRSDPIFNRYAKPGENPMASVAEKLDEMNTKLDGVLTVKVEGAAN